MEFKSNHYATDQGLELGKKIPPKKLALWVGGGVVIFALLTGGMVLLFSSFSSGQLGQLKQEIAQTQPTFTVFYPKQLPAGFAAKASPDDVKPNVVVYRLTKGDNEVVVTQQTRPALTEEVNKVKDVATQYGKAFIADLNGRKTGFLTTDNSLVVVSSQKDIDVESLEALLTSLTPL